MWGFSARRKQAKCLNLMIFTQFVVETPTNFTCALKCFNCPSNLERLSLPAETLGMGSPCSSGSVLKPYQNLNAKFLSIGTWATALALQEVLELLPEISF